MFPSMITVEYAPTDEGAGKYVKGTQTGEETVLQIITNIIAKKRRKDAP